jgi:hypothetical protein
VLVTRSSVITQSAQSIAPYVWIGLNWKEKSKKQKKKKKKKKRGKMLFGKRRKSHLTLSYD